MMYLRHAIIIMAMLFSASAFAANYVGSAWPNGTVRYYLDESLTEEARANFLEAVDYFHEHTLIRFVSSHRALNTLLSPAGVNVYGITSGNSSGTYGRPTCFAVCIGGQINLRENANVHTAAHEIFHVLGFYHEHERADRDDYITLNKEFHGGSTYIKQPARHYIGAYDVDSLSHYRNYGIDLKTTDPLAIYDMIASNSGDKFEFRIRLKDDSVSDIYNTLAINNQNDPTIEVTTVSSGWHSALWIFEFTGEEDHFNIKNKWTGQYLAVDDADMPILTELDAAGLEASSARWRVVTNDDHFQLVNTRTGDFLTHKSGLLSATSVASPASSRWLLQRTLNHHYDDHMLSLMDNVALHVAYGHQFRITHADGSGESESAKGMHVLRRSTGDGVDVGEFEPGWHAAMWELERRGEFFMVKNLWTGLYLHREFGEIALSPAGTVNDAGTDITGWWSAQWKLEPQETSMRIKNRWTGEYLSNQDSALGLTPVPSDLDANWNFKPVDWNNL